jgi:ribosomal protection tetracycline resistance protein
VPTDTVGALMPALTRLGGTVEALSLPAELTKITALLPVTRAGDLQRQLAGLTRGEGVLESRFAGYQPVVGDPPTRRSRLASGACR